MKEMKIEENLIWLTEQMQKIHDKFEMHEWVRDHRPLEPKGEQYFIECRCGTTQAATKDEFFAAEIPYNGY